MIGCGGAALACSWPSSGTAFQASKGPIALSSANETPKVGDSWPGKWMWLMWTRRPTTPAIATRPCLISAWRKKARVLSPPIVERPYGSKTFIPVSGPMPSMVSTPMTRPLLRWATADIGSGMGAKPITAELTASISKGDKLPKRRETHGRP